MQKALESSLAQAKKNGFFSYPNHNLTQIPSELIDFSALQLPSMNWWEASPLLRLDLSNNQLETLPPELLTTNPEIFSIRAQNNKFSSLPQEFFPLDAKLKSIDFTNNKFQTFPDSLKNSATLVEILLPNNALEDFPDCSQIKTLESLQLNNNKLNKVPKLHSLNKLKILNLSNNKIKSLEQWNFSGLVSLEQLILRTNLINNIPPETFRDLKKLVMLDLSENQLESFQTKTELPSLDSLLLAFNRIKSLANLNLFGNLTVLDLKNNKIQVLDVSVAGLKKLKTLDVSNNDLIDLPNEIGFLQSLIRISCIGNPIKSIKPALREAKAEVLKQYLRGRTSNAEKLDDYKPGDLWEGFFREFLTNQELVIREKLLETVDQRVFQINGLKTIDFSKNKIKEISGNFANLENLKIVRINENLLEYPPFGLEEAQGLVELELQGNKLRDFYEKVSWKALKLLDLSRNSLFKVPKIIITLPNLKTLNLAYNQLQEFELICLPQLSSLNVLDISNNKIQEIPAGLWSNLRSLTHLNLENNELVKIPSEVGFMKLLKSLKVDGNPLKLMRRQVIEKGTIEIMNFLRSRHVGEPPAIADIMEIEEGKAEESLNDNENEYAIKNKEIGVKIPMKSKEIEVKARNLPKGMEEKEYKQRMNIEEEKPRGIPQNKVINSVNIEAEVRKIDEKIKTIENELESNYGMNKFQKEAKKKELRELIIQRNQLKK